ncbi:MAG TPA: phosphoglycerate dehydrogenase [Streptosporangiaceae bacterium]|nr:phosphoglycerate dehydrogenase [Streptosporangiaceae bacterium]
MKALLLENIHQEAVRLLDDAGLEVTERRSALGEAELADALKGVGLLGIRSKTQLSADVLAAAPDLLAVGAFCIGTDQIDLAAASALGIAVFNAPYSNTRSVVELTLAEIIGLTRRLTEKDRGMHAGVWDKSASGAHEVRGRTLGIVGYGNIGAQLSVVSEALGLRVVFYDTADKLALGNARRCVSLEELLEVADVVSLHVDGRPSNSSFFGEKEFSRMRPGALFLNLCRGFVIDHDALRRHLLSGHLAGAAVDVFRDEPRAAGEEFQSVLRGLPNVILTPHIGGSTEEAQADIGAFVGTKLADFVADGATSLSVNLPQVALPPATGTHRLAHVHRNVPGVMAEINSVLAAHDVNVEAQLLGTRGDLGYALTDIAIDYPEAVVERLREMSPTVRLRVLS